MLQPNDYPVSVQFDLSKLVFSPVLEKVERRVSDMAKHFHDKDAAQTLVTQGDKLLYEVLYHSFETSKSDMVMCLTRIFSGTVGDEYHMTKGHIHARDDQAEIYFCLQGEGYLLLQTLDGEFRAERWTAGTLSHIPPMWAHRTVNTGTNDLVFVSVFNLSAGYDYGVVEAKGFKKLVVEHDGQPTLTDNPRWNP
jgi:glucose-6-phosphate isomerase, archaeal